MTTTTPHASTSGAIAEAATLVADTATWLRSDQAAVMRQLPEQQSAYSWWMSTGREQVDSVVAVPEWIAHFYGETVTTDPVRHGLSPAATAVAQLLAVRADELAAAPIYLIEDPTVVAVLVTLTASSYYTEPDGLWPAATPNGTVLFSAIPLRQHTAPGSEVVCRDNGPELRGLTWFSRDRQVRVNDWIQVGLDRSGVSDVDRIVAEHADSWPGMVNNGEWSQPITDHGPATVSRGRLHAATVELAEKGTPLWDLGELQDPDTLLVPRLAAVAADAFAAGLFDLVEHQVPAGTGHRFGRRARSRRSRTVTTVHRATS
ncbi:hypothetical protein ACFQNE_03100 [Gordonia phosphorivorans]|uniref:Uncharacterized protein n=1 Tax=Gordonia phosphorivorans TaxID=1056982 RepID=A0ABV6H5Q3_9ACTN